MRKLHVARDSARQIATLRLAMPRAHFTHKKRRAASSSSGAVEEHEWDAGIELTDLKRRNDELNVEIDELHSPFNATSVPNMKQADDRQQLALSLYAGNYGESMKRLREDNAVLITMLGAQIANQSDETETLLNNRARLIDGMLLDICRAQNINSIPVLTAAMSILGEFNHIPREYHDTLALYHRGAALSEKWVRDFMTDARAWRPPPIYDAIPGVVVAVFDNLSMKVDYSSYSTEGETGRKLDMTNWLSTTVPKELSPSMDARSICTCGRQ